jgi:hypothetical protein
MLLEILLTALPFALPQGDDQAVGKATVYQLDRIETLAGEVIENGAIIVRDGIIERLGQSLIFPDHAKVIDLRGTNSVAMPPFALTHVGFLPSESRGRGRNSKYLAANSVHYDKASFKAMRKAGVLLLGIDPPGTGLPGRTAVVRSDAKDLQADALVQDLHLKLTFTLSKSSKDVLRKALKDADSAIEKEAKAKADWQKARKEWDEKQKAKAEAKKKAAEANKGGDKGGAKAAQEGGKNGKSEGGKEAEEKAPPETFVAPKIDPNLVPVIEWVQQKRVAQVWIDSPGEWLHWLDIIGERELSWEAVLGHGSSTNLHEVAAQIGKAGVRIFMPARISTLPSTRIRMNLPLTLQRAGVEKLVLMPPSARNLRSLVDWKVGLSDVVREGLDREIALRAVSVEAAASMGQEELLAPLTAGGPATFVLLKGDPLDPLAEVSYLIAAGDVVYDRSKDKDEEN